MKFGEAWCINPLSVRTGRGRTRSKVWREEDNAIRKRERGGSTRSQKSSSKLRWDFTQLIGGRKSKDEEIEER